MVKFSLRGSAGRTGLVSRLVKINTYDDVDGKFFKRGCLSVSLLHPEGNNDGGDDDDYIIMTDLI